MAPKGARAPLRGQSCLLNDRVVRPYLRGELAQGSRDSLVAFEIWDRAPIGMVRNGYNLRGWVRLG